MRKSETRVTELELREVFSGAQSVQKSDLRDFYLHHSPVGTEQAFRRFLYGLEKKQIVTPIGAGVYVLHDNTSQPITTKKHFSPSWSSGLEKLNDVARTAFPYAQYIVWETRVLHEFMVHQPGQNLFILETEKDVCDSAFNLFNQQYPGRTFLDPARLTMERYVLPQPDSILISRLVTQSPRENIQGIPFPKLEKILVDVFSDREKYFYFQGEELVHIFENAFNAYWINEKTLFRYAGRRTVSKEILQFIHDHTQITLSSGV